MSLTADRNTPARVPQMRTFVAGADIFGGAMVAINASGKAVPAADAAGLVVVGRAEYGAKAGENVSVKAGCFAYDAPTGVTVTVADIGKTVFVVDDQTVAFTGTTHATKAGVVFDVDDEGVWVVVGRQNYLVPAEVPALSAAMIPDLSESYLEAPTPASATADVALTSVTGEAGSEVYAAGDGSANLLADLLALKSGVNAALAVLRSNGFIAAQ